MTTSAIIAKYQRDVNCLSDADRSTRGRALKRLQDALFGPRSMDFDEAFARSDFLAGSLLVPLFSCITDQVEKNRLLAIEIINVFLEKDSRGTSTDKSFLLNPEVVQQIAASFPQAAETRIHEIPFPEQSEEIRLAIMEVMERLLIHPAARDVLVKDFNRVVNIVAKCSMDSNPDNKRQSGICVVTLCQNYQEYVPMAFEMLLLPTVSNMKHQRAKVRSSALQAVHELILTCWKTEKFQDLALVHILPVLRLLNQDNSPSVRMEGIRIISDMIVRIPQISLRDQLLPILLFALSDQARDIQVLALDTIENVGKTCDAEMDTSEADRPIEIGKLPEPFQERPGFGARKLVRGSVDQILPDILKDTDDWTAQGRFRSISLLRCVLVFVEERIDPYLDSVLTSLTIACNDDETTIREISMDCARLLGMYVSTDRLFGVLLPKCVGENVSTLGMESDPKSRRTGALSILTGSIYGLTHDDRLQNHLGRICCALFSIINETDSLSVIEIFHVCQGVVDRATRAKNTDGDSRLDASAGSRLLACLLALSHEQSVAIDSDRVLMQFALTLDCTDGANTPDVGLLCQRFDCIPLCLNSEASQRAKEYVLSGTSAYDIDPKTNITLSKHWTRVSTPRRIFDSYVRKSYVSGLANRLKDVVDVLLETSLMECDPELRLTSLSLLEDLISRDQENLVDHYLPSLISRVLIPNLVWRAGRVPATIRKVSAFCLSKCVGHSLAQGKWWVKEFPELFPTLQAALDDMEADTRRFACDYLKQIFTLFLNQNQELDAMIVSGIYHNLVKRLDDADDKVRLAGGECVVALCKVSSKNILSGTLADYISDACFIHLDDNNPVIQAAVFDILRALITRGVDVQKIGTKAEAERNRHRSPDWCDKIIVMCRDSHDK